eukprot:scaffold360_cov374-Pavlova_lutheri.AAC.72
MRSGFWLEALVVANPCTCRSYTNVPHKARFAHKVCCPFIPYQPSDGCMFSFKPCWLLITFACKGTVARVLLVLSMHGVFRVSLCPGRGPVQAVVMAGPGAEGKGGDKRPSLVPVQSNGERANTDKQPSE